MNSRTETVCENPYIRKKLTHTEGGREEDEGSAWTSTLQTMVMEVVASEDLAAASLTSLLGPATAGVCSDLPAQRARLPRVSQKTSVYRPAQGRQHWCISP